MTDTATEATSEFYPGSVAAAAPDKVAQIMVDTGEQMTYRELDEHANRLANFFRSLGLSAGDHVAFCMENHPRFLAIVWGCHYAGLHYTAISSRLTDEEMIYIINDCGAEAFITTRYKADVAESLISAAPNVKSWLMLETAGDGSTGEVVAGYESYEAAVDSQPSTPIEGAVEGADMLYSSGTTGRPKGVKVPLPNKPLGAPAPLFHLAQVLFGMQDGAVYLSPAPLYHAAPLRFCMSAQRAGATVVVMPRFDPTEALRAIDKYKVTTSQWVPTMFVRMLKLDDEVRESFDTSSLQCAIHAAAPCPIEVKEKMIGWWGPVLHEYYAGTEGNGFCYLNSEDWMSHKGSVGQALTGEIHICDEEGEELPVGEAGTIFFGNGGQFEYHNDSEKTNGAKHANGWTTLGDIGKVDEDGFLYLTDRKAYMIISGGVNIYPQEAENVLTMHPSVFDVAVIGVPNDDFGEEVKAVVQPADSATPGPELARELIAYCREQLADVKCPRSVDFVDELPRHPTGKLYKRLLRDKYWEGRDSKLV